MIMLFLLVKTNVVASENIDEKDTNFISSLEYTPKFGVSPFNGVLGLEVKSQNIAIGIGYPRSLSVKYYTNIDDDSWYFGVFTQQYKDDEFNDFEEGVFFNEYERKHRGVGFGYMWIWPNNWNVNLGLGLGPQDKTYRSNTATLVDDSDYIALELNVGYRF